MLTIFLLTYNIGTEKNYQVSQNKETKVKNSYSLTVFIVHHDNNNNSNIAM